MTIKHRKFSSLQTRIITSVSIVVIFLMLTVSFTIFIKWRHIIIEKEKKNAFYVTEAFSIFVLNTLIYSDSKLLEKEYVLESYIHDFMKNEEKILEISVFDNSGNLVSTSNFKHYKTIQQKGVYGNVKDSRVEIIESDQKKVFISCAYRLKTGNKLWGTLSIKFDGTDMKKEIKGLFRVLTVFPLILLFGLIIVISLVIRKTTFSLRRLSDCVDKMDLDTGIDESMQFNHDEVGILAEKFREMHGRLSHSKEALLQAQRQVFHAEKLASIGRLASGVAHEINNPLNGIKNCLYTIKKEPDDKDQLYEYLELVSEALDHIEMVVKKLLGFSRKQSGKMDSVNLNDAIEKVLKLLEFRFSKDNIQVNQTLSETLPDIKGDTGLLQEVFMNILLNSFDAMPDGGVITITTRYVDHHVTVKITDNGTGISNENLERIFDPFFTTKEQGKGTGLGLSVVVGIIESHGGDISVTSEIDSGTSFTISLPRSES